MGKLLEVRNLTIGFPEAAKGSREIFVKKAVDDISFALDEGEVLGIVGESGSGKTITALTAAGLQPPEAQILGGSICFDGQDVLSLTGEELSGIQGKKISMIFQEPMTSLNPVLKIERQVAEPLVLHTDLSKEEIHRRVIDILTDVGLPEPEKLCKKYPHELSGGMRQRVMIALAMICEPKLLIADEPTTALDVIVQDQILKLILELHQKKGVAVLFISHDLNVVRKVSDHVIVMRDGKIVESGSKQQVFEQPKHEYTRTLIASFPGQAAQVTDQPPALSLKHVNVYYQDKNGRIVGKKHHHQIVKDVSFDVREGEFFGIVGESGCGKSTLARAITGLNPDYDGEILFLQDGVTMATPGSAGSLRRDADGAANYRPQMVFQDPFGSLNPVRKVGWIMTEPLRVQSRGGHPIPKEEQRKRVEQMLLDIGLAPSFYDRYPRELSGGTAAAYQHRNGSSPQPEDSGGG